MLGMHSFVFITGAFLWRENWSRGQEAVLWWPWPLRLLQHDAWCRRVWQSKPDRWSHSSYYLAKAQTTSDRQRNELLLIVLSGWHFYLYSVLLNTTLNSPQPAPSVAPFFPLTTITTTRANGRVPNCFVYCCHCFRFHWRAILHTTGLHFCFRLCKFLCMCRTGTFYSLMLFLSDSFAFWVSPACMHQQAVCCKLFHSWQLWCFVRLLCSVQYAFSVPCAHLCGCICFWHPCVDRVSLCQWPNLLLFS